MNTLKIIHIIPSLSRGGAERFVVDLCNELSKKNEVFLISLFDNDADSFKKEVSENVRLISLGKKPGFDIKAMLKLMKVIKNIAPHVVNSHISALEYLIPYSLFKFKNRSIKFFHTVHNEADKEVENPVVFFIRKTLFRSKLITPVTISKSMSKSFQEVYNLQGYDKQVDNGRPYRAFDQEKRDEIRAKYLKNDQQLFVNVARIDAQKNQLNLVRAFKDRRPEINNAVLLVLGDVRNEELYNEIIAEIKGEPNIYLLGGVSNVEDYLAASDAFILPSIYEGMPISLIEALSHGCVPICSPVGGITDMIEDGVNGFLTAGILVEDISNTMLRYLNDENKEMIKDNAKTSFHDRYAIETTGLNYLKAYEL
ncbi:glycosyltransferase [Sphingobacterium faecium]|uniref:glycosyltransferase n=1 Tax=Sphingobacterium faecium TaxID=34087 RepID=UPI0024685BF5|nr:glycosyltransferase [Sphingobacterium faecium]MDH5828683.1 glycosyltransferase [Sphingobacterium faecium]